MGNHSRIAYQIKAKTSSYCCKLCTGLNKPQQKFVQQMVYGMISRKSVLLTEIARSLPQVAGFKKIHERLSLNLSKNGWKEVLENNLLEENKERVQQNTVIALDISDLVKEYAQKMEYLCRVRDGSSSDKQLKNGYWLLEATGINREQKEQFPLLSRLYSSEAVGFASENRVVLTAFRTLQKAFAGHGIYTFDRGGDREKILNPLLREGFRFVIRMIGTRDVMVVNGSGEKKQNLLSAAQNLRCRCQSSFYSKRHKKIYRLSFGSLRVKLPFSDNLLTLIVVKGFGNKPMMLLSTEPVRYREQLWDTVQIYLARWGVEELIRFKKQAFDLENIRVMGYKSLQNMMILVNVAIMFLAYLEGNCLKLSQHLSKLTKHLPRAENIKLLWYRLIDGIARVMSCSRQSLIAIRQRFVPDQQLELPFVYLFPLEVI